MADSNQNEEQSTPTREERGEKYKAACTAAGVVTTQNGGDKESEKNFWMSRADEYLDADWDGEDKEVLNSAVNDLINDIIEEGGTEKSISLSTFGNGLTIGTNTKSGGQVWVEPTYPVSSLKVTDKSYGGEKKVSTIYFSVKLDYHYPNNYDMYKVTCHTYREDGAHDVATRQIQCFLGTAPSFQGIGAYYIHPGTTNTVINVCAHFKYRRPYHWGPDTDVAVFDAVNNFYPDEIVFKQTYSKEDPPTPGPGSQSKLVVITDAGVSGRHCHPFSPVINPTVPTPRSEKTIYGSGGDGGHGGGGGGGAAISLQYDFETERADYVEETAYVQQHGYGGKGGKGGKGGDGCVVVFY